MATKSTFDPGGVFSGDLWKSLDDDTKEVFRNLLKQAGLGMQAQAEETQTRASVLRTQRDVAVLTQAGVRPGQYLSARQRREILNPESVAEQKARLQFHGGVAGGRWVTDYDTWKANRTANDDERLTNMKPLAFRVPTARENFTLERSRRLKDLEDAYDLLKTQPFDAEKGGATMRERGWLDAVFNGGIVRAALKGGKGRK